MEHRGRKSIPRSLKKETIWITLEYQEVRWYEEFVKVKETSLSSFIAQLLRDYHRKSKSLEELREEQRLRINKRILEAEHKKELLIKKLKGIK
jgi:hypothetical protein